MFLKFLKNNKKINFQKYEDIHEDKMKDFLKDFGDFFND